MSVPQFSAFTNFVGGLFSLDFTYSLSAIMYFAYLIQDGARQEVEASILLRVRRLAMTVEFSDGYADLKGHGISACLFSSLRAAVLRRLVWVLGLPYWRWRRLLRPVVRSLLPGPVQFLFTPAKQVLVLV